MLSNTPLTDNADAIYLESLAKGDLSGFSRLYDKYAPMLLGVIRGMIPDPKRSEEILQNLFTRILSGQFVYNASEGRVFTWLLCKARQLAMELSLAPGASYPKGIPARNPAVTLVMYQGRSYPEAARLLGISETELTRKIRQEILLLRQPPV